MRENLNDTCNHVGPVVKEVGEQAELIIYYLPSLPFLPTNHMDKFDNYMDIYMDKYTEYMERAVETQIAAAGTVIRLPLTIV